MSDERYRRLRFLFKVDYIEPNDDNPRFDDDGLWLPRDDGIFDRHSSTGWLQRTPENVTRVRNPGDGDFAVCSLLYRSATSYFFAIPADCTKPPAQRAEQRWRRIRFDDDESQNLSVATFYGTSVTLAGRGSRDWVPELLPDSYNASHSSDVPFTHLTGDLALIVALIASSCPRERDASCLIETMQRCFRPPRWVRHRSDPQRIDRHGVVVTIRLDPEAGDMRESKVDLQKFQRGDYGALLKATDSPNL
ncbi:uncharacterized protein GIQ15_06741 [Arthroderma uncinatum]|uniref:uncharacterized protein n=1 Tax=Arthroderma uncinatum TaxID=74035 RepID=UPI00144ACF3C|nr:uncharacterized protein GIQ15_06741 [Arthroderma uncinatum]KAF3479765.1 hypothetical protein GIQ15_06741 [Arthroderma uncinatum]